MESRNFAIIRATKYDAGAVLQAPASVVERRRRSNDMGTVRSHHSKAQPRVGGRFVSVPHSDRFWSKVNKNGPTPQHRPDLGPCWEWTAGFRPTGYGVYDFNGKPRGAHRVAYELVNGPIPNGLCVLHACDNPKCVNPSHLAAGTQEENIRDMHNKGRYRNGVVRGKRNPASKLTDENIRFIRRVYVPRSQEFGQVALARRFGVSRDSIRNILVGKTWRHVK